MRVTQKTGGPFLNIGPAGIEEVLGDNLKDWVKLWEPKDAARE